MTLESTGEAEAQINNAGCFKKVFKTNMHILNE